ncbi:T9SS type A sorting domain-containing protein [Reichenbachiella carrageenanivorans]|uniref:T9SS type A sorting domain-containing protein n=1 Tax=Reichenbachiella carrageenanivorans TaxID=2979869 RepID=A0ABY6CVC5_9BACT|nr:T9SS type A sorting domain-containing protein [Reichenbachiella carrageenanivorans]UXX77860.1 T9SS type A sorting domain-containing protein [Reichenbachiella carrageenanivorans]
MRNKGFIESVGLIVGLLLSPAILFAQTVVDVHVNLVHKVGDVTTFDRSKFVVIHANFTDNDWTGSEEVFKYLADDLDVYFGRDNGSLGWYMNQATEDADRSGYVNPSYYDQQGSYVKKTVYGQQKASFHPYESKSDVLVGGQTHVFWEGNSTHPCCGGTGWEIASPEAMGEFMGNYFNKFYRDADESSTMGALRPRFMEILNEPLYELIDGVPESTVTPLDVFTFHNQVADEIRLHNDQILIGGYTAAFPYYDENNFQRWNDRMKLFYDTSGDKMDFVSIHLYDFNKHHYNNGSAFHGPINYKGSRIEATLDMMQQYSYMSLGEVKPLLISEYGGRDHSIEWKTWSAIRDWQFMKSISPMLMQFMRRPDEILKTIPFITAKADWGYKNVPYPWRLLRKANEPEAYEGAWVYTEMIKFYELWSDVKGTRVFTQSSNPDVLVDSYVDGQTLYVILSNLNFENEQVQIALEDLTSNVESINIKQLYLSGQAPVLDKDELSASANIAVELAPEATAILAIALGETPALSEQVKEVKYYADAYLKPIEAGKSQNFTFSNVSTSAVSRALLRIGIGRTHELSKQPVVSVNGTPLVVPTNYAGDSQALRNQFFGLLEVEVPAALLKTENNVEVSFADAGGHISSVTMQVFESTRDLGADDDLILGTSAGGQNFELFPNPAASQLQVSLPQEAHMIMIYRLDGVVKWQSSVSTHHLVISTESWPRGLYVAEVYDRSGKRSVKKLVLK